MLHKIQVKLQCCFKMDDFAHAIFTMLCFYWPNYNVCRDPHGAGRDEIRSVLRLPWIPRSMIPPETLYADWAPIRKSRKLLVGSRLDQNDYGLSEHFLPVQVMIYIQLPTHCCMTVSNFIIKETDKLNKENCSHLLSDLRISSIYRSFSQEVAYEKWNSIFNIIMQY